MRLEILPQPNETTCGPTCLHAVYNYYGLPLSLDEVVRDVPTIEGGGTLDVLLACDALQRGFHATIFTYNLILFDPSWFTLSMQEIKGKLIEQAAFKRKRRLQAATGPYVRFIELGGRLRFEDLSSAVIRKYLKRNIPIIAGLSATYLYGSRREYGASQEYDDIRGEPTGHFVVLCGYDGEERTVQVADPFRANPLAQGQNYVVPIGRAVQAIMLGIVTYDANLIIIEPREGAAAPGRTTC